MEQAVKAARLNSAGDWGLALLSVLLLVLAFPDFNLSILAWVGLVPLMIAIARRPKPRRAFFLGWFAGSAFFYATCYWLTYSIIHYGDLSPWLAYALLLPGAMVLGLFPGLFALTLARLFERWGMKALFVAPLLWVALEWFRLSVTGQLWNAIGYSQAFHPSIIQVARWGGVYAVGFLIVTVNAALAFAIIRRTTRAVAVAALVIAWTVLVPAVLNLLTGSHNESGGNAALVVVAVQPNVRMDFDKTEQEMADLLNRHVSESEQGLSAVRNDGVARLVIWPESPMNFTYGADPLLRERLARFTQENHTSLLFNSQEAACDQGFYNSALLINEEGRLVAQYDKIRLMPFGEYVPLPAWVPGSDRIKAIVGGFVPGTRYTLMPVGATQVGVFICIESAYPWIARTFAAEGAQVLLNISNDGYLGPTAVMRQHLANAIFRAVENGRPVLRVTNTGITAYITNRGEVRDATSGFQGAVRTWTISNEKYGETFYTKHGELFVGVCGALSMLAIALSFRKKGVGLEGCRS